MAPRAPEAGPRNGACFPRVRPLPAAIAGPHLNMGSAQAEALANLLPLMLCGEESAILAFDALAQAAGSVEGYRALRSVADEEGVHETLLASLAAALPPPSGTPPVDTVRRFFHTMGDRDVGRHFLKIAALDSGLCCILSEARAASTVTQAQPPIAAAFARIHQDEARHVTLAVSFARQLRPIADLAGVVIEVRARLAALIGQQADSFDTLRISPERVLARLGRSPAWLAR